MMDSATVRARNAHPMGGRLPRTEPVHVLASYGHGALCAGCGCAIERMELEYEIEWDEPARTLRMHGRCYELLNTGSSRRKD
jgi:hypothetical protein